MLQCGLISLHSNSTVFDSMPWPAGNRPHPLGHHIDLAASWQHGCTGDDCNKWPWHDQPYLKGCAWQRCSISWDIIAGNSAMIQSRRTDSWRLVLLMQISSRSTRVSLQRLPKQYTDCIRIYVILERFLCDFINIKIL